MNVRIFTITILLSFLYYLDLNSQDFEDVSINLGINSSFGSGNLGGGVSFIDFNRDGWDDLTFATEAGRTIEFYVNRRGYFEKIPPLVDDISQTKSVLWVDIDNDGDKDFFISSYFGQNRIFENIGDLNLVDITSSSGLIQIDDPSFGASFGDYDRDGYLDLYTTSYFDGAFYNRLYKNNGNKTFSDMTASSGVETGSNYSFQGSFIDYNNNLDPDIYVAVDKHFNNLLFKNLGNGQFSDVSVSSGAGIIICAMNSGGGDYDNDGDLDLYITNIPNGNVLLRNDGDETFTDVTASAGVGFFRIGWATSFFDYDNDGDLDMYVSASQIDAPNALYINNGDGTFSEPLRNTNGLASSDLYLSHCNTQGDFNHDGLIDIVVSNENDQSFNLWENKNENPNNWIKVDLEGTMSNRDGIGVWIRAYCDTSTYSRYTYAGDGYLGQQSEFTHIGVKDYDQIDSLQILWPSGIVDSYFNIKPNQFFKVIEGSSASNPNPCPLVRYFKDGEITNEDHLAELKISSKGTITTSNQGSYRAGDLIELGQNFIIETGGIFEASIEGCND